MRSQVAAILSSLDVAPIPAQKKPEKPEAPYSDELTFSSRPDPSGLSSPL